MYWKEEGEQQIDSSTHSHANVIPKEEGSL